MRVSPGRLEGFLKKWNVNYKLVSGWDSSKIDPYKGKSNFVGIILHHTAGTNSLNWVVKTNPYAPVRACHFLVDLDGTVQVVSGVGAYHAGRGGPWRVTKFLTVPKDMGNSRFYGIEIESLGTSAAISGTTKGMSVEQVVSTALLCGALLEAMSPIRGFVYKVGRVIRHKDWAPTRKSDVRQDLKWWRDVVAIARQNKKDTSLASQLIREYVKLSPKGKA